MPICLFRTLIKSSLLQFIFAGLICCCAFSQKSPVYPPDVSDIESLKKSVAFLTGLSVKEVTDLVPTKSGFYFIGCPNCNGGAEEAEILKWKPGMGDKVRCNFCQMDFPNEKFPNNREVVI